MREYWREKWEVQNFPEAEIWEMVMIYKQNGIEWQDAIIAARTLWKYPDFWVDHMMMHEIEIMPPDEDDSES